MHNNSSGNFRVFLMGYLISSIHFHLLLIIGGLNWGLVGVFSFDLVAWLFGGQGAVLSRIVYILVALSAAWCISLLFRDTTAAEQA